MSFHKSEPQTRDQASKDKASEEGAYPSNDITGTAQPVEGETAPVYKLPDAPPATEVQLEEVRARDSEEVEAQEEQRKAQDEQRQKNQEESQKRLAEQRKKQEQL